MTRIAVASFALMFAFGSSAEAQILTATPRLVTAPRVSAPRYVAPSTTSFASGSTRAVTPAPARPGQLRCVAEENGAHAAASFEMKQNGQTVAQGSCESPVELPPGAYVAHITLETALDRPTRAVPVQVAEGGVVTARASFQTAILEVRFTDERAPVHGLAMVRQGGRTLGTLGSGVTARVSAGTYEIVARHRTEDRTYTVSLAPGQRRALRAAF